MSLSVRISTFIAAPPAAVWAYLERIDRHSEWMRDAVGIVIVGEQSSGVGTTFECDTRMGPLSTTDVMRVTSWEDGRRMGVSHSGLVSGEGEFILTAINGATLFEWRETLKFPWRLGGPIGEVFAKPIFVHMWRANLGELKHRVESGAP